MPSPAATLLADLAGALASLRLRWYVFGAQAVIVHGRPRLTEDVDVTVELGSMDTRSLVDALEAHGFELSELADDAFVAATRVLPFSHASTGMALDIVLAGPGLEELFLDGAEPVELGGVTVPVIRVEHLLVTKILAARPKDLEDAREILLGRGGEIDLAAVRGLLEELEAALGQSDLVPVLERLLGEAS